MKKEKNSVLKKETKTLFLEKETISMLEENNLQTVEDIWNLHKDDLKKMNFSDLQIRQIVVQLQLLGLDLNRRIY